MIAASIASSSWVCLLVQLIFGSLVNASTLRRFLIRSTISLSVAFISLYLKILVSASSAAAISLNWAVLYICSRVLFLDWDVGVCSDGKISF